MSPTVGALLLLVASAATAPTSDTLHLNFTGEIDIPTDLIPQGCPEGQITIAGQCKVPCPDGWTRHRDACYFVDEEPRRFVESKKYCASLVQGAQLTPVLDSEEQTFVHGLTPGGVWIGLEHLPEYTSIPRFRWLGRNRSNYRNWMRQATPKWQNHLGAFMHRDGRWEACLADNQANRAQSVCKYVPESE